MNLIVTPGGTAVIMGAVSALVILCATAVVTPLETALGGAGLVIALVVVCAHTPISRKSGEQEDRVPWVL
jgi:hypothetical protein